MTTKVTKESLAKRIESLEARGNAEYALRLTLEEEFKLDVYRMLLDVMERSIIGYTTERAAYYEVWNSGSAVFTNERGDGDVALMVAPDFIKPRSEED